MNQICTQKISLNLCKYIFLQHSMKNSRNLISKFSLHHSLLSRNKNFQKIYILQVSIYIYFGFNSKYKRKNIQLWTWKFLSRFFSESSPYCLRHLITLAVLILYFIWKCWNPFNWFNRKKRKITMFQNLHDMAVNLLVSINGLGSLFGVFGLGLTVNEWLSKYALVNNAPINLSTKSSILGLQPDGLISLNFL